MPVRGPPAQVQVSAMALGFSHIRGTDGSHGEIALRREHLAKTSPPAAQANWGNGPPRPSPSPFQNRNAGGLSKSCRIIGIDDVR